MIDPQLQHTLDLSNRRLAALDEAIAIAEAEVARIRASGYATVAVSTLGPDDLTFHVKRGMAMGALAVVQALKSTRELSALRHTGLVEVLRAQARGECAA